MGSPRYIWCIVQVHLCHYLLLINSGINCNPWHKCWFTQLILLIDPSLLSRACRAPELKLFWYSCRIKRGLYEQGNCMHAGQCSASLMKRKDEGWWASVFGMAVLLWGRERMAEHFSLVLHMAVGNSYFTALLCNLGQRCKQLPQGLSVHWDTGALGGLKG